MPTCPSCNAEIPSGSRWCSLCHSNVLDTSIGRLASPGLRLAAFIFDILIPMVALFLIGILSMIGSSPTPEESSGAGAALGFFLLLAYVIWALILFARGTTPGKKLLGMRVVKESGKGAGFLTMLIREWIGKWISGLILSLGFLWILFDKGNQGWHDKLVSTYVVKKVRAAGGS